LFTDSRYPTARFSIDRDDESARYVYRLIDSHTNHVIKQFPRGYVLRRLAYYRELTGIRVNSEALAADPLSPCHLSNHLLDRDGAVYGAHIAARKRIGDRCFRRVAARRRLLLRNLIGDRLDQPFGYRAGG